VHFLFVANALLASGFWVHYVSSGFQASGLLDGYYVLQAQAILEGRLSISPGPLEMFYHDVSLYGGSYYFYWGMLPAALFVLFQTLCGATIAHYAVVWTLLFTLVYSCQLILALIIRVAENDPLKAAPIAQVWAMPLVWLFIFNPPFHNAHDWFFGRFIIYEQAIVFGLAPAMLALFLILRGLERRAARDLCAASFLLCVASWSRPTWGIIACLSIPLALWAVFRLKGNEARFGLVAAMWLGGAFLLLADLALINFIRFETVWDFGFIHANSQIYLFQRSIVSLFSAETRFWNFLYSGLHYYAPASLIQALGIEENASVFVEGISPSLFDSAPQFFLPIALSPIAFMKVRRVRAKLVAPFLVAGAAALYIAAFLCAVGILVVMRFFMESYIFLIIFLFTVALILCPLRWALGLTVAWLIIYVPHNAATFLNTTPELRLLEPGGLNSASLETRKNKKTFFMEPNPVWHRGSLSARKLSAARRYNVIGLRGVQGDLLGCDDILAAYIIPQPTASAEYGSVDVLHLKGVKAIRVNGSLAIFLDRRPVGLIPIRTDQMINISLKLENPLPREGPVQTLLAFYPANRTSLSPRPLFSPAFAFTEMSLGRKAPGSSGRY
jgi:hypothetical protein